jgi:hypothetical protein
MFVAILKDIFLNSFVKELTNFANFPWKPSVLEAQVSYKRIPKAATPSSSTYNNRFLKATKNIKKKSAYNCNPSDFKKSFNMGYTRSL